MNSTASTFELLPVWNIPFEPVEFRSEIHVQLPAMVHPHPLKFIAWLRKKGWKQRRWNWYNPDTRKFENESELYSLFINEIKKP